MTEPQQPAEPPDEGGIRYEKPPRPASEPPAPPGQPSAPAGGGSHATPAPPPAYGPPPGYPPPPGGATPPPGPGYGPPPGGAPGQGFPPGQQGYGQPGYGQPGYGQPGYGQPGYGQVPGNGPGGPGALSPSEERTWATLTHVGAIFFGFLSPLVVLLVQGPKSPFVREHAVEDLNFQITMVLFYIVAIIVTFITCGVGIVLFLVPLIFEILAAVAANNGQAYRFPFALRLVS